MKRVIAKVRGEKNSIKGYILQYDNLFIEVNRKTLWALSKAGLVDNVVALSSDGWQLSGVDGFELGKLLIYSSEYISKQSFISKRHKIIVDYLNYKNKDSGIKRIVLVELPSHSHKHLSNKELLRCKRHILYSTDN